MDFSVSWDVEVVVEGTEERSPEERDVEGAEEMPPEVFDSVDERVSLAWPSSPNGARVGGEGWVAAGRELAGAGAPWEPPRRALRDIGESCVRASARIQQGRRAAAVGHFERSRSVQT